MVHESDNVVSILTHMNDKMETWLNAKVAEAGSIRRFAKKAGISHTTVADVLAGVRKPTFEFCNAVAKATNESPEQLFRIAGLIPERFSRQENIDQLMHYFDQLDEHEQMQLIAITLALLRRSRDNPNPANPEKDVGVT